MPPGSFAAPELDQAEVSGVSTQTLTCTLRWGTLRAGVGGGGTCAAKLLTFPCDSSHRLPVVIIPKKYQPLPPEPEGDVSSSPQRHPFPEVQRGPR